MHSHCLPPQIMLGLDIILMLVVLAHSSALQPALQWWYISICPPFRFCSGLTVTFSKYIPWYEGWLFLLNLLPWHQETDITVSNCSKKTWVLTPATARLQSFWYILALSSLYLAQFLLKFCLLQSYSSPISQQQHYLWP